MMYRILLLPVHICIHYSLFIFNFMLHVCKPHFYKLFPQQERLSRSGTGDDICNPVASKLLLNFQNCCGVRPASCSIKGRDKCREGKAKGREASHSPPASAKVKMSGHSLQFSFRLLGLYRENGNFCP